MKKTLLIGFLSLLWFITPVKAQLEKGTKYLGGTISFGGSNYKPSNESEPESNQNSFNPSFQIGKMIGTNRMIGLEAGAFWSFVRYKYSMSGTEVKSGNNQSIYRLSPFVRQYKSINAKFAIFLHTALDLSYLRMKSLDDEKDEIDNGHEIALRISPGIAYWITPRFALESDINLFSLGVGYQNFLDRKSVNFNSAITTSLPSYFSVRASWYFQKK